MARQIVVTDDIDGSPEARTITYSFDGQKYEIDLSQEITRSFAKPLRPSW